MKRFRDGWAEGTHVYHAIREKFAPSIAPSRACAWFENKRFDWPSVSFSFATFLSISLISSFCAQFQLSALISSFCKFQVFSLSGIYWHALSQSAWRNFFMYIITTVIICMKKFLHSDWLRAVQFFLNSAEMSWFSAKISNKPSILIGQGSKKLTDGQSNLLLSNQAHALDGAIDGAICPWFRVTLAFLLLNHLEIFSCILLISNHMIFLCNLE